METFNLNFTDEQINRYSRHILLREVGGEGQKKLLKSKVLVIGAGGLGSPLLLYLAAAGIGTLGVIDHDEVDLSNLQRQILHNTSDVGKSKAENSKYAIKRINPDVTVNSYNCRLSSSNAFNLISEYDVIADGSDNFATRFLINDAAYFAQKILVSAAILKFDGQISTFKPYKKNGQKAPCYRCIFRSPPPQNTTPSCSEAGVLGALCGVLGSFQASEIIKELLGIGHSLAGYLVIIDGLNNEFRKIRVKPDLGCPLCGKTATIKDLTIHER